MTGVFLDVPSTPSLQVFPWYPAGDGAPEHVLLPAQEPTRARCLVRGASSERSWCSRAHQDQWASQSSHLAESSDPGGWTWLRVPSSVSLPFVIDLLRCGARPITGRSGDRLIPGGALGSATSSDLGEMPFFFFPRMAFRLLSTCPRGLSIPWLSRARTTAAVPAHDARPPPLLRDWGRLRSSELSASLRATSQRAVVALVYPVSAWRRTRLARISRGPPLERPSPSLPRSPPPASFSRS